MLGLVDRAAHPRELALELGHPLVQHCQLVLRGARAPVQLLLDLGAQRPLRVDVLLGRAQHALPVGDLLAQPVGLRVRLVECSLEAGDAGRLRLRPARALIRRGGRHVPDRERDHRPAELEKRPAPQRRRQPRRNREAHPPRAGRRPGQGGRLGHGQEPLPADRRIDHEHRLPAQLGPPSAPPAGHPDRDAALALGQALHCLDSQQGGHIGHPAHGTAARGRNGDSVCGAAVGDRKAAGHHQPARGSGGDDRPRRRAGKTPAHVPLADLPDRVAEKLVTHARGLPLNRPAHSPAEEE